MSTSTVYHAFGVRGVKYRRTRYGRGTIHFETDLKLYRTLLLKYFDHRITCAMIEGTINKIKTLKRQTYGFRDDHYFALRLYHLHQQRYSLAE